MDQDLRQIADRTLGGWLDYRESEIRADRTAGRRAASGDVALLIRRHADFQDGLIGRAKAAMLGFRGDLAAHARDLARQVADLARERDEHIGERLRECREERQQTLQALERSSGPRSAPFVAAQQAVEETEKAHRAIRAEVHGRPLRRSLVDVYLPLLAMLALIEVPVNRLAFELFFQEQPAFSLALAVAAGIVLMFFAHLVGMLIRRAEQPPRSMQIRRAAGAALFLLLTGSLIYVLASMRQLYVHLLETEATGGLQQQIERLMQGGTAGAIRQAASTGLGLAGLTLLVINVALFAFGAAASFLRHDAHPDYEAVWRAQQRARKRLARLTARHEKQAGEQQRTFDQRLGALDELMRETQARHDTLAGREAAIGPFFVDTMARVANTVRNRSLAFLEGALAALPAGATGASVAALQALPEADIRRRILPESGAAQ